MGTPQREQLIPLEDGKPVKPAHVMAMTGTPGALGCKGLPCPEVLMHVTFVLFCMWGQFGWRLCVRALY